MLDLKSQRMKLERDAFMGISSFLDNQKHRVTSSIDLTSSWDLSISCDSKERNISLTKSSTISWDLILRYNESYILFSDNNSRIFLEQSIDYHGIKEADDSYLFLSYGRDPFYLGNIPSYVLVEVIKFTSS